MTTIKAYTDLSQSKILAEILPLESADMYFEPSAGFRTEPSEVRVGDIKHAHPRSVPCWSLAALLDVLPTGKVLLHDKSSHGYKCIYKDIDTNLYSNSIDACVTLIEKLHEQKLL